VACHGGSTDDKPCQFYPGTKTVWDPDAEAYEEDSDGSYGAPYHDSVDTEWSKKWVDQQTPMVREAIINGNFRIGRDTTGTKGEAGANLMLPLPGNPEYPEPFNPETYQKLLQRDHGYSVSVPIIDPETGASSTFDFELGRAMRSGGFPMCPNYWDAHGGDNPGPLNHASKDVNQDGEIYKFPNKVVGSPLVGDPELHFCRKWQEKYDATCCATYLDEDIQEEYEELTGSGYLGAHVFVQQYLCLPCHPMISCMIDESTSTLRIPLEFAKKLADKMEDFDRTGLKVKIGEEEPDNGPLRQDELYIPSQYFAMQRGSGGGPAPPFPPPNCANNADPFPGVDAEEGSTVLGYWPSDDCPDVGEVPGCGDDDCEETFDLNQHAPDEIGRCSCTGPGKDCACVREFLLHLRPPGINGYDGLDLNIEIVDDDDACGVLYDLMAGSILDPLLTSSATSTLRAGGVSWSLLAAGVALTALLVGGGGGGTLR